MTIRRFAAAALVSAALVLTACSTTDASSGLDASSVQPAQPANLVGDWTAEGDNVSHIATITEDTISVDWFNDEDDSRSVYWVGTYEAPTEAGDFAWESARDEEATASALLASQDDTKTFNYEDGKLSFEVTALGTTKTVILVPAE
ncbi:MULTISPECIES: hypothetical protein [unclassified Microbacterium]|uniref:hypothetical protein n=1 Tax=unclassified Microbacterium TaxID=2609290 RepID=UPI0021A390E6|nr:MULTISPECIES: hypothetical protein [unclassified Microbacterium]MCT1364031.1 hypothetical protein [Microbacterium sp. p3-SID131]MCT1375327.1 hypothetical protein [Microbacterium sp. p3-SID337]